MSATLHVVAAVLVALLLYPGLRDVPISRDEGVYHAAARNVQAWLRLLASSPAEAASYEGIETSWRYNHEHPGLPRLLAAASNLMLGGRVDPLVALRFGNVPLAVLLVLDAYHFMRRSSGIAAGLFAACAVLLITPLYGHACIAAMDFPVAALGFLATTAFARGIESRRWSMAFGLYLGLALDSKINAMFVPLPLVLWALVFRRRDCMRNLIVAAVVAPCIWFLAWPWLWHDTFGRLSEYVQFHRAHNNPNAVYWGEVFRRRTPPWHYPWVYLSISTPLGVLVPALACAGMLGIDLMRHRAKSHIVLLFAALLTPVAVCSLPGVPRYEGARLFLTAFPFLACLAGEGFARAIAPLASRIAGRFLRPPIAMAALGGLMLGSAALGSWRVHPFEPYSFYNSLVGGTRGAFRLGLSPVLWGMADRKAVAHLNRFARPGDIVYSNTGATLPLRAYRTAGLLRRDLRFGPRPHWVVLEYNLAYSNWGEWWAFFDDRHPRYDRVLQVEAAGAPVLGVFRARSSTRGPVRAGQVTPPPAPSG
jgi:4-amino-4-deoxy-L-arabinose transferase-like glycosyltransferase